MPVDKFRPGEGEQGISHPLGQDDGRSQRVGVLDPDVGISPFPKPPAVPVSFEGHVTAVPTQTTCGISIRGKGATPGGRVDIGIFYVPHAPRQIERHVDVSPTATTFEFDEEWPLVQGTQEDADVDVWVFMRDETSGAVDIKKLSAGRWIVVA